MEADVAVGKGSLGAPFRWLVVGGWTLRVFSALTVAIAACHYNAKS